MTFKILTTDSNEHFCRSNVRAADDLSSSNLKADNLTVPNVVKYLRGSDKLSVLNEPPLTGEDDELLQRQDYVTRKMSLIDPIGLVGRSFIKATEDGQHLRVKIINDLDDYEEELNKNPTRREFLCATNENQVEEILSCNETL